jgi:predicted transcriptional regulator
MTVSLRVPGELKKRIAKLARESDTTPHAFMLEALREKVEAENARLAYLAEASCRLARMKKTGTGIPGEEVFEYLQRRAEGHKAARPKARKIR